MVCCRYGSPIVAFELLHELLGDDQAIRLKEFVADLTQFPSDQISRSYLLKLLIYCYNFPYYGVVLLEMISTREPTPRADTTITEWAARYRQGIINMEWDADVSEMFDLHLLDSIARDDRVRILSLPAAYISLIILSVWNPGGFPAARNVMSDTSRLKQH
ncbi:hypothetical protein L1887_35982 [Cichorium endivia]|nr:hypothetical protein L1887_35982 [Cichorium endivia]